MGKQRTRRKKQQGGFGGLFNLPAMIGSLFAPKKAPPRRRPPRRRRPPPNYQPSYRAPTNYRLSQSRAPPRRRPPPLRRAPPRQKGGFIADSVNYGFDEENIIANSVKRKLVKKQKKQKWGSVLPMNKIPWVKRVDLS